MENAPILTKATIDRIIGRWKGMGERMETVVPLLKPQAGFIPVPPIPYNPSPKYKKKKADYKKSVKGRIAASGFAETSRKCYAYVDFMMRQRSPGPDVDNLLKMFFDAIKGEGGIIADDGQIIGIKSQLSIIPDDGEEGTFLNLVPAWKLKIHSVADIAGEELKNLNGLRAQYLGKKPENEWRKPMQMVGTNRGVFFDTEKGKLWSVEPHEQEGKFLHRPEPGFDWKSKEGQEVDGVMVYERSACWWINKWSI